MTQSKEVMKQHLVARSEADREMTVMAERIADKVADRIVEALGKALSENHAREPFAVSMRDLVQEK